MTNEIEKEFFDAFGIKPKPNESGYGLCLKYDNLLKCDSEKKDLMEGCPGCEYFEVSKFYPTITDRILLELIVINNKNAPAVGDTLEELKNQVLYWCIQYKYKIYHTVRKMFGINSPQKEQ